MSRPQKNSVLVLGITLVMYFWKYCNLHHFSKVMLNHNRNQYQQNSSNMKSACIWSTLQVYFLPTYYRLHNLITLRMFLVNWICAVITQQNASMLLDDWQSSVSIEVVHTNIDTDTELHWTYTHSLKRQ